MTQDTLPSTQDRYVIVGDGIAGSSAAETLAAETDAQITVLTAESEPLYNRVMIKEFAKGTLPESAVQIHDRDWYEDRGIDLRLSTRVVDLDTRAGVVQTDDGEQIASDELVIATGGSPRRLPVPNADADGVTSFWTIEDAARIREQAASADSGVIVGGGLLGIDYAAIASTQDVDAHYLIREDRWFSRAMSETGAAIVHDALRERGVTPVFETEVERFETDGTGQVSATVDDDGQIYDSDCVGVAIGTEPNVDFLAETPIAAEGGVRVDEFLRTDVPGVWAAGDVARYHDRRLDRRVQNGSWGSAAAQGDLVAQNLLAGRGDREAFAFVPSYTVTHFEFPMASFGHPALGETYRERQYDDREWRRLAFRDGKLVGGVLIGDLAPMGTLSDVVASGQRVQRQSPDLLARDVELPGEHTPVPAASD
ncbi:NAD(P)/FAD-dependent oxidoreductase [Halococcoides cellulosivorans]|uniref:NADH oxidase n=1 Tax=Halococcoides cellulosivorans TaxID=1679096 RepID=A0A2R4WXM0_9EURY|nr:FAD-dependent oxidoreductase [Halococcoides cellulosivorans]AWB26287.1 NADH oxidase [Halococcoides cellulosivorans]